MPKKDKPLHNPTLGELFVAGKIRNPQDAFTGMVGLSFTLDIKTLQKKESM